MASEKITNILEEIKTLTIIELADLVKAVEDEFGVSAAAPVGVVAAAGAAAPAAEEETEFDADAVSDDIADEAHEFWEAVNEL